MLKRLSDKELLQELNKARAKEKKLTIVVLELLQEVENRKLYCDLGYHTLFAYVTKHLGYSEAEASVRVNATRLVNKIPEIKEKINDGSINLTQASKMQSFFRREDIEEEKKREIIEEVSGKSTRETEKFLGQLSITKKREKKITINERMLKKIEQIQKDYDGLSEIEVIESLIDNYIEQKKRSRPVRASNKKSINQRYIPRQVKDLEGRSPRGRWSCGPSRSWRRREEVDLRAGGRCEYVSPITGERCNCRTNLAYDHIQPVGMGGKSIVSNLRKLCFNHNMRAGILDFGMEFMEKKVNSRVRPRGGPAAAH